MKNSQQLKRRRVGVAAALLAGVLIVLPAMPAAALGTAYKWCYPSGQVAGYSYRNANFSGGGSTQTLTGCNAYTVYLRLQYQPYPGGPYYLTGQQIGIEYIGFSQTGTSGGRHSAVGVSEFSS